MCGGVAGWKDREGPRGVSKEEVLLATERSGEIGTPEAPTLIFYSAYHILVHMYTPPPTHDHAEDCIILPSEFTELTELFAEEKLNVIFPRLQSNYRSFVF